MKLFPQPQNLTLYDSYSDATVLQDKVTVHNHNLQKQEYILRIDHNGVTVESSHEQGAYYAELTLAQVIKQQGAQIQHMLIHDYPDFEDRGVSVDVGRFRVLTLKTLYRLVDILSAVKINQLQLYFEGFPFAYSSHPKVWKNKDVLTGEDIQALDSYCKSKFIELVPCQNGFGHMKRWLARDEYRDLAESPEGFQMPWGYEKYCTTLDPLDPRSFELSKSLYMDILPYFSSKKINICSDETFELGKGKNKGKDPGKLYFDFLMKLYSAIKEAYPDREMMFWGDVVEHHPEYISQIPEDLVPIVWKYDPDQPTPEMFEPYKATGGKFYICSATHTHCTLVGKTGHMKRNVDNCTKYGKQAGAVGYINTKWGDAGNWDIHSASYLPLVYGGVQSWNTNAEHDVVDYVSEEVFQDKNGLMGKIAAELGDFFHFEPEEPYYNGNWIVRLLYYYQLDDADRDLDFLNLPPATEAYFDKTLAHVTKYQQLLEQVDLQCPDREEILFEYRLAFRMILHAVQLGKYKLSQKENREALWDLYDDFQTIMADYRKCWFMRNRNVGLDESMYRMYTLKAQYETALDTYYVKV